MHRGGCCLQKFGDLNMGRKGGWGGRCHTITNIVSDHYHYQPPPLNKQSNGAFMENRCVAVYLLWHPLGHWNLPCKHSALDGRAGKAGMERGSQIKLPFSSTDTSLLGCLVQVSTVHVSGLIPLLLFHRSTSPPLPHLPISKGTGNTVVPARDIYLTRGPRWYD